MKVRRLVMFILLFFQPLQVRTQPCDSLWCKGASINIQALGKTERVAPRVKRPASQQLTSKNRFAESKGLAGIRRGIFSSNRRKRSPTQAPKLTGYFAEIVTHMGQMRNESSYYVGTEDDCVCPLVPVCSVPSRNRASPARRPTTGRRRSSPWPSWTNVLEVGLKLITQGDQVEPVDLFNTLFRKQDTPEYSILRTVYERVFVEKEVQIRSKIQNIERRRIEEECVCKCDPNAIIRECEEVTLGEFTPDQVRDKQTSEWFEVVQLPERGINQTIKNVKKCRNEGSRCNAGYGRCQTITCYATLLVYEKDKDDIAVKRYEYPSCCSCV